MQRKGLTKLSSVKNGEVSTSTFPTYIMKQFISVSVGFTVQQVFTTSNFEINIQSPYSLTENDILSVTLPLPNPLNTNLKLISTDIQPSDSCDSTASSAKATCQGTFSTGTLTVTKFVPVAGATLGTNIKLTFPNIMTPLSTSSLVASCYC